MGEVVSEREHDLVIRDEWHNSYHAFLAATSSLKKQVSVSQHSSISQADDLSSPYARVRSPLHAYDKVRPAEHPYAQLKMSGTGQNSGQHGNASTSNDNIDGSLMEEDSLSRRGSHQSLLDAVDNHQQQVWFHLWILHSCG